MSVQEVGPGIAHPQRMQVQLLFPETVDDATQACVHIFVHNHVAEVVANGDARRSRVPHVADARQRMWEILQHKADLRKLYLGPKTGPGLHIYKLHVVEVKWSQACSVSEYNVSQLHPSLRLGVGQCLTSAPS